MEGINDAIHIPSVVIHPRQEGTRHAAPLRICVTCRHTPARLVQCAICNPKHVIVSDAGRCRKRCRAQSSHALGRSEYIQLITQYSSPDATVVLHSRALECVLLVHLSFGAVGCGPEPAVVVRGQRPCERLNFDRILAAWGPPAAGETTQVP